MAIVKELGANTIRLAHYQHAQEFYDLCDENGMIVWAEIPYITMHMADGTENTLSQMRELVVQNYQSSVDRLLGTFQRDHGCERGERGTAGESQQIERSVPCTGYDAPDGYGGRVYAGDGQPNVGDPGYEQL